MAGDAKTTRRRRKPAEIIAGRVYRMGFCGGPNGRLLYVSRVDPPKGRSIRWVATHEVGENTSDRPLLYPLGQFMREVYAEVPRVVQ